MGKVRNSKKSKFFRKLKKNIKYSLKNPFTYLFFLIVLVLVAATIVVGNTEPYHPDGEVTNWKDAIWHSIVAVVAAYYDYYMKTVPGRLASLVLLLVGMAFWTIVLGKITSAILSVQSKNNKGLKKLKRMKGHFLLCGWRPGFETILEAVINQNPDIDTDDIVLVNNAPLDQMDILRSDSRFAGVKFIAGDFSDADVLKKACIETAERALVIADYSSGLHVSAMEVDSRTVLAVLTMKNTNKNIYVSAELLSSKFEEHLRMANVDELILTQDYEHSLLATASSGLGYSNVIKALISDDADTGILIKDIAKTFAGKTYKDLIDFYEKNMGDSEVLVGLLLNAGKDSKKNGSINQPVLTPPDDFVISESVKAVVVRGNNEEA